MSTRWLFLDMNAFFASVEQQEVPELRGRPVIVVPALTDSTCAIAASYEAKRFGIKTGTMVHQAKELCPELLIVPGRTGIYRTYHKRIVDILNRRFATIRVLSVDEMACRLSPLQPEAEEQMARIVKEDIRSELGECLTCSVGIAPNIFLAKVASEIEKPNGLVILRPDDIPNRLLGLNLRDLPGIGRKMLTRLQVRQIMTVEDLYRASYDELKRAVGSVVGNRWWFMIRGSKDVDYGLEPDAPNQSIGHSHVLPPELRTRIGVEQVMFRLLSRALQRMRRYGQTASSLQIYVRYSMSGRRGATTPMLDAPTPDGFTGDAESWKRPTTRVSRGTTPGLHGWAGKAATGTSYTWHVNIGCSHSDDDVTWFRAVRHEFERMPDSRHGFAPLMVGLSFSDLCAYENANLSLFDRSPKMHALAKTVDRLNSRFPNGVDLASVYWIKDHAPERIAFGASLLKETGTD